MFQESWDSLCCLRAVLQAQGYTSRSYLCCVYLLTPSIFPSIRVFWSSLLNEIRLYSRTWTPGGKDLWGIPRGWLSQCLCWTGCWSQHCSKIQVRGACNRPHALEVPLLPSSSLICLQTAKGNRGDVHTENPPACLQTCFKKAIMKEYKAYKLYLSSYSAQINPF